METKVKIEDILEDLIAMSSNDYIKSIEEAREDYRKGRVKKLEDISDV